MIEDASDNAGLVVSHGVDIVEVPRIQHMLDRHGDVFINRCFTDGEQAYANQSKKRRAERYAVRFACKEAVLKALGTGWRGGISWRDMDVSRDGYGKPSVQLTGRSRELADSLRITGWRISLSHTEAFAVASVIGLRWTR